MILSLWSVPDKQTQELMSFFYTELAQSMIPMNAFMNAQKKMRLKYWDYPELWAGFIYVW